MTVEYESHGLPLVDYQLSRADHRRQQQAEDRVAWVEREVAKAPRWSEEKIQRMKELFESQVPLPPWEYMRWRVRLYCGHIQEIERHRRECRPDRSMAGAEGCSECGKNPAVIVGFELIGPAAEPPTPPQEQPWGTA